MSISVIIIRMMTEMDIETSVHYVHLMRLIAREDYIKFYYYIKLMGFWTFSSSGILNGT